MNRRIFTQLLIASPLTALALANAFVQLKTISILIQTSPVAGFQYYSGKYLWEKFQDGQTLDMLRELTNPYDNKAVALFWDGYKISYVPRNENLAISQMLDTGVPLQARIAEMKESDDPWQRVSVNIELSQS